MAHPDILLLDEPTNHLDLAGIEWLEKLLQTASFACVVVSHDRYFLENIATGVAELNRVYAGGLLRVPGNYSTFLEKKSELLAAQAKRQEFSRTACGSRWIGCGVGRRREPQKLRRVSTMRTS